MTKSSEKRVERFVDEFIRSEYVQAYQESSINSDFGLYGRFGRCMDAAEYGADGSTHAEVINDWRQAFNAYLHDRRAHKWPERFESAVLAHFDHVWDWHHAHGSLTQQIG